MRGVRLSLTTLVYNLRMRPVIIVFAKAPIRGRVKTRLIPQLTPRQTVELHTAMVWDTIELLQQLHGVDIELHTDIPTDAWTTAGVAKRLQSDGDLGLKMLKALDAGLAAGHGRAMIAGSDSPALPLDYLEDLLAAGEDVALGPTEDGGYYAICCRRVHAEMFDGVEWSTQQTREQTIQAARRCGLSVRLGRPWFDIDTPEDLARLRRTPGIGRHTARMIL